MFWGVSADKRRLIFKNRGSGKRKWSRLQKDLDNRMDKSAILPDGSNFPFWEAPVEYERELHVNRNHPMADDANEGTLEKPLCTINAAAQQATAGTRVLIHGGEYRECVRPAFGGTDPAHMISYEAFGDGEVVIKASGTGTVSGVQSLLCRQYSARQIVH